MQQKPVIHFNHYRDYVCPPIVWEELQKIRRTPEITWPGQLLANYGASPLSQNLILALFYYEQWKQQTFIVGPNLQWGLEKTDVNVAPGDLKLPYPCFYVYLPQSEYKLWGGERTEWHQLQGCYCFHYELDNSLRFYLWCKENEKSLLPGDDAAFFFALKLNQLHKYKTVEEYFDDRVAQYKDWDMTTEIQLHGDIKQHTLNTAKDVMRVVLNMVLYLNSDKPETVNHPPNLQKQHKLEQELKKYKPSQNKYQRIQKKLQGINQTNITLVYPSVENDPRCSRSHASPHGHMVRGHWQSYHVGPRTGNQRIRKWKTPFPRGDRQNIPDERQYKFQDD